MTSLSPLRTAPSRRRLQQCPLRAADSRRKPSELVKTVLVRFAAASTIAVLSCRSESTGAGDGPNPSFAAASSGVHASGSRSSPSRGFNVVTVVLYQPDSILAVRVQDGDSVAAYIADVRAVATAFFDGVARPELLDIVVAVKPLRRSRAWFVAPDRLKSDPQLLALQLKIEKLRAPTVVGGPIAFAMLASLGGAQRKLPDTKAFQPPIPDEWTTAAQAGGAQHLSIPDDFLAAAWPESG